MLMAIRNLVCDVHRHREIARELGLIPSLLGILKNMQKDESRCSQQSNELAIQAIGTLRNMCYSNRRNREAIAQGDGISLLA